MTGSYFDDVDALRTLVASHQRWVDRNGSAACDDTMRLFMEEQAQLYALECEPGPDAGNHDPGTEDGHWPNQCLPIWPCWEGR